MCIVPGYAKSKLKGCLSRIRYRFIDKSLVPLETTDTLFVESLTAGQTARVLFRKLDKAVYGMRPARPHMSLDDGAC